jgi:CheY-like chemotaxis protein
MARKPYGVLLADDSEDDRLFIRRAFRKNAGFAFVGEAHDGELAIAWLAGEGEYGDRDKFPFPDVLLLDLKMPRKTGHEVLEWLQSQPFEGLRVVVLSGSFLPTDIERSRQLGAHAYFKKDVLHGGQQAMITDIEAMMERP